MRTAFGPSSRKPQSLIDLPVDIRGRRRRKCGPPPAWPARRLSPGISRLPSFQRPQQADQRGRRRLQQRRNEDVVGAEAHAMAAQSGARCPGRATGCRRPRRGASSTPRFSISRKATPRAMPVSVSSAASSTSGLSSVATWLASQRSSRAGDAFARGPGQLFVGEQHDARAAARLRRRPAWPPARPASAALPSAPSAMSPLARAEALGAPGDLGGKRLHALHRVAAFASAPVGSGVRREPESHQTADMMAFDNHFSGVADFGFEHRVFPEAPHQDACPAVNEPFRQAFMQCIGKPVLDLPGRFLPMGGVRQPSGTVRKIGPGPDMRDARRQGIDVAVGPVGHRAPARRTSLRLIMPVRARSRKILPQQPGMLAGEMLR